MNIIRLTFVKEIRVKQQNLIAHDRSTFQND